MLVLKGKNDYLHFVGAIDRLKALNKWKMSFGLIQELKDQKLEQKQKQTRIKPKKASIIAKILDTAKSKGKSIKSDSLLQVTKLEKKLYYKKCKQNLRKSWDLISESESNDEDKGSSVPLNFKKYNIQNRTISIQQPKRENLCY